ncbi:MAG: thioesterase family protein [Pseudomonas sp.]|nr:thioesterase family protein [Pseudomonas sp.]
MLLNRRKVTIEWGDCDPAGIVFYPRYFSFFDASTAQLFAVAGFKQQDIVKCFDAIGFPMVDTRAKFYIPSKFGDEIEIETTVTKFRNSSFDIYHRVLKNGELAIECFETRVWVGKDPNEPERLKSKPIPKVIIDKLSA